MKKKTGAVCPNCKARVKLYKEVEIGDIIICPNCSEDLEISNLSPQKVKLVTYSNDDDDYYEDENDNWFDK